MGKDLFGHAILIVILGLIPIVIFPSVFTPKTIVAGLAVIALLNLPAFIITAKKIKDPNPNALIRTVMAGTMIKFLLSIVAVGIWLFLSGGKIHKPDLYWLMGAYLIVTLFDAIRLSQATRQHKP
jgi:hypothetical protein